MASEQKDGEIGRLREIILSADLKGQLVGPDTCMNCGHERSDHYKWILHHDNETRDTLGCAVGDCVCEEFEENEEPLDAAKEKDCPR